MASTHILTAYIKKLSHPLKEIRERSLQLLIAKLQLGWELEDELAGTRELLDALLAWFYVQQPSLQREAFQLLLTTIRTKAGAYIVKEFGIKKLLFTLNQIKSKIEPDALEVHQDVIETLRFMNTVASEDNVSVPPLALHSLGSSESDGGSSSDFYNLGNYGQSSKGTSVSNDEVLGEKCDRSKTVDGIEVLLFPWLELSASDSKTILLVEDALKLLKSTRRCCRFIRDVFLRDFPAEVFLNRPAITSNLLAISDGSHGGRPGEALHVLLCITNALRARLLQLSSVDLIHEANKVMDDKESSDRVNLELEQIAGDGAPTRREEDALLALKQLPAPIYALDTLHSVLSTMARSIALLGPGGKSEVLDLKESNTCLCLVESLTNLLLDCVSDSFWNTEHISKTHRDIAHKSCMVMRLLGDILMKYRKSFLEDTDRCHHRIAWLCLVSCAERLLNWARESALPPSSLVVSLQAAQLDPALDLLYPALSNRVALVLQNTKILVDREYKSKYRELKKLFASMEDAVQFMKNKDSCRNSKKVLQHVINSLPVLELHQSEAYLYEIAEILLMKTKSFHMDDNDWTIARNIALNLMAHNIEWVRVKFYTIMAEMVRSVLVGDEINQTDNEKSLTLLCDVGILTEICCHGLSSECKEVAASSSDIMLYMLRGRLVLTDGCWWRLLASLLPVLPLLHVYAAHDTQLGQAICKSLETDIAECMGVSLAEVTAGLVRMLFVRCATVQLDAVHSLCRLLDDERYLPPGESLRADVLLSALGRVKPQDFNVDYSSSPSKITQTTGLAQILDVLKQDLTLDEHGSEFVARSTTAPTLDPSLRRSTLQQLSVMLRQQDQHDAFLQYDGLKVITATLRMSMMVDDYLAYPECAISCVSILNSICFTSRHALAKIPDLSLLLLRVILVFPANDSAVLMSAQILALTAWSGFALQELDASRRRVPALPLSVTQRTSLPFVVNSYWNTSPNAEHSSIDWLLSDEDWRASIRVHWWCACEGGTRVLLGAAPPPAPLSLHPTARDLASLRAACPNYSCTKALLNLENATSHRQVNEALNLLEGYTYLLQSSSANSRDFGLLPWQHTRRFLCAPPASARDVTLLVTLLQFIIAYLDNIPKTGTAMSWIKSFFIGKDATVISLLSRTELYPQQTPQEIIEVTQLHIHIVKVLLRCIILLEHHDDYDTSRMESLVKILLACLDKVDLKNFHMLGYLNELVRCIKYALNSRYCKLSEDTIVPCLRQLTVTLSGCASGAVRKGQACRLDTMLSLLALLRQIHGDAIPVQVVSSSPDASETILGPSGLVIMFSFTAELVINRWSEVWNGDVVHSVVMCSLSACAELRAVALHVMAVLAHHSQFLPHLLQAIPEGSLTEYAAGVFSASGEANAVRTAAALLLAAITARASPHSDVLELDVLVQLKEHNFLENCLQVLVDFCNQKEYKQYFEPNVPLSILERRTELEVRARKTNDVSVSPLSYRGRAPPTAELVAAIADVLFNVNAFPRCPVLAWNDSGLYRILFRCASWSNSTSSEVHRTRMAVCRVLSAASTTHKCVRATLSTTKDCLHNLLVTLTPFTEDEIDAESLFARAQAFLLVASLLSERSAAETVWRALQDHYSTSFLHSLLQSLQIDDLELQDAGLYCFTQLCCSATTKDETRVEFFDSLKSPFTYELSSERQGAGDTPRNDCQPDYMTEEYCKVLMNLYQKLSMDSKCAVNQDERWSRVCTCLASLLSASPRSRLYGVHRQLPRVLLATLQAARDRLALQGSADAIRSAPNNPMLRTLYWLLTVIDCHMLDCPPAKESFAEDSMVVSLNRLWPWCMLTTQLRDAVMHLLLTFSNDCPKAWSSMSVCVGAHNLVGEVCTLMAREASTQSRPRPDTLLLLCLRTLRHTVPHHHCRTIILKSDSVGGMYKARVRERGSSSGALEWARLVEALARHADGCAALLALRPLAAAPPVRSRLLPALAHVARHRRSAVLQAPDLLELLSGTLLAGDTAEIVSAARAVWALAANNHKAKLLLRSAGVAAAVQSCLQRLQRAPADPATQRALQLMMYTNTVLQTS